MRQGCVKMGWRRFGRFVCVHEFFKEMVPENWWDVMDVARRERRDFNKGGLDVFYAWRCYQPFIWGLQIKKMNLYWTCVWGLDLVVLHGALSLNQEGHGFVSVILVMIFSVLGVKFCRPPPPAVPNGAVEISDVSRNICEKFPGTQKEQTNKNA